MPLDFALIDQVNLLEYFCFVAIDKTTTDDTDEIPFLQKKNENDQSEARTNEPTKIRTRLKMYVIVAVSNQLPTITRMVERAQSAQL